jgi:Ran GTPase-activating protein (RanGAP) involved in mRNA processing and transport
MGVVAGGYTERYHKMPPRERATDYVVTVRYEPPREDDNEHSDAGSDQSDLSDDDEYGRGSGGGGGGDGAQVGVMVGGVMMVDPILKPELDQYPHCHVLKGERLGQRGAVALSKKLALRVRLGVVRPGNCAKAQTLNLSFCRIGPHGCRAMSKALEGGGCPHLKVVNFQGNQIGMDGAVAFCVALLAGACQHLEHLNLRDNLLEDEAGRQIGATLYKKPPCSRTLRVVDLKNNALQMPAAMSLVNALVAKSCPRIQCLNVRDNHVSTAGRKRLGRAPPPFLVF